MTIPPLPSREVLAELCRRTASRERVQPIAAEKDFYLTRILWALGQHFGDRLLLKGGTLLSKVDLGYKRMSEDADFVIPWNRPTTYKGTNAKQMNEVRDALRSMAEDIGSG